MDFGGICVMFISLISHSTICLGAGSTVVSGSNTNTASAATTNLGPTRDILTLKDANDEEEQKFRDSYNSAYFSSDTTDRYVMTKKKIRSKGNKRKCIVEMTLTGRGITDRFEVPCTMRGGITDMTETSMSFGTPGESSLCLYSEERATLVILRQNTCTKKTYGLTPKETPMSAAECEVVKEEIKNRLGTSGKMNFGDGIDTEETVEDIPSTPEQKPDPPVQQIQSTFEYSRKGSWWTTKCSRFSFTVKKVAKKSDRCVMSVAGWGVNDSIEGSCLQMGEKLKMVMKNNKMVVAQPGKTFGVFTDTKNELIVYNNGECTKRSYDTSFWSGNTKITSRPMSAVDCGNAWNTMTSILGV